MLTSWELSPSQNGSSELPWQPRCRAGIRAKSSARGAAAGRGSARRGCGRPARIRLRSGPGRCCPQGSGTTAARLQLTATPGAPNHGPQPRGSLPGSPPGLLPRQGSVVPPQQSWARLRSPAPAPRCPAATQEHHCSPRHPGKSFGAQSVSNVISHNIA